MRTNCVGGRLRPEKFLARLLERFGAQQAADLVGSERWLQSSFAPEAFTFFSATSRSVLRKALNCSGVSPTGSKPRLLRNFSLNSAVLTIFDASEASFATISRGVPA